MHNLPGLQELDLHIAKGIRSKMIYLIMQIHSFFDTFDTFEVRPASHTNTRLILLVYLLVYSPQFLRVVPRNPQSSAESELGQKLRTIRP